MTPALRWTLVAIALIVTAFVPAAVLAERFTPSITPTHLPLVNGISSNAMLLTLDSMPPGLTPSRPAYVAPTAAQLADDDAAWAWIAPTAGLGTADPLAFVVTRVSEIAVANLDWQLASPVFFALRMFNGSVQVYEATGGFTSAGVAEFAAPYWLSGVYSEMTAGESHMCFLTLDQHAECITTTPSFQVPSALMTSRSAVAYTQISAASRFTCGLRAVDQLVECFGGAGRNVDALLSLNYTSTLRYASIAAQFDSGFCGVVVTTGELACYSVRAIGSPEVVMLAAPTLPFTFVYPLWIYMDASTLPWGQACAMRSDGKIGCVSPLPVGLSPARPMSQATTVNTVVMGATSDNGQFQRTDPAVGWLSDQFAFLFEALRFIGVDPALGDDTTCTVVRSQFAIEFASFIPCASLTRAMSLIAHPNTWIQLLPGTYIIHSTILDFSSTTIASVPPPSFTPADLTSLGNGLWVSRMQQTAAPGRVVTLDSTGAFYGFYTIHSNIQFIGLTLTGSAQYAIWSFSDESTDENSRLPVSTLILTNCVFDAVGAAVIKVKGRAIISGCSVSNSLPWADSVYALMESWNADLTLTGTNFSNNHMADGDTFLRSCLLIISVQSTSVTISDSHWFNNSASSSITPLSTHIAGGVGLQVQVYGNLVLSVADCSFKQQAARCSVCFGGAAAVLTDGAGVSQISVAFTRVRFEANSLLAAGVDPYSQVSYGAGSNYGGSVCRSNNAQPLCCDHRGLSFSTIASNDPYVINSVTIRNSFTFGYQSLTFALGGGLLLNSIRVAVLIDTLVVHNTPASGTPVGGSGGALGIYSCGAEVRVADSAFAGNTATFGGAINILASPQVSIVNTTFEKTRAFWHGGAINAVDSALVVQVSQFTDVGLQFQDRGIVAWKPVDRLGGVLAATGGSVTMNQCSFTRVSALPNDLQLSSCAKFYDTSSGLSSIGLGAIVSVESSDVFLLNAVVTDATACGGGLVYARSSSIVSVTYGSHSSIQAYSGGLISATGCVSVQLNFIEHAERITSVTAGGALALVECTQVQVIANRFADVSVTNGDGGLIWMHIQRRPALVFTNNTLTSVTAPAGAGAVIFLQSAPNAFSPLDPIDDPSFYNQFLNQSLNGQPSLYGPLIATGVATLSALQSSLSVPAGELLSTAFSPLQITAHDALGQVIYQDRGMIVQVSCPAVEFRGTILRRISATDGSALFTDLRVIATPGNYTLLFSIVTAPTVSIALNLTVTADCPAASFYSSSDRSCVECASDILVYDAIANACERCPAGWQRVSTNDTTGALRDGVSCEVCPLGQVSTVGSLCAPCGPNTYQPVPLSECVACSAVDGLNCVGDGLARVESGFFAMAIGEGTDQRIYTYQCPESFCSAAQVQVATAVMGNSSSLLSSSAVNSFSQCAFPRLASPTNLLCGSCAAGYRPWGNKCAECDSVDGGLLFGLLVLSLVLLAWLLRSSLGSPSAGHAVVVLYFVQTAMLELGSINELLAWLNVVLLSPNSVGRCVAPLSPYQQTQAQILMPVALWIELMVLALMHWAAFKRWGAVAAQEPAADASRPLASRVRSSALRFVSQWSVDVYVSATLSLLLFTYTQVAVACVSYLRCVEVGSESVVFSQPAMRCGSDEYAQTRVLVVFALVTYVAGLPVAIAAFLWRRSASVQAAHALMSEQLRAGQSESDSASAPPSSSSPHRAVSSPAVSDPFLRRYAPLFAMYSSSAWFWQVFVLCRRTVFVTVSVLLLPTPRRRFLAFALSTLLSQLIQLYAQPFRIAFFNRAELASHALLLVLSMTLAAEQSPYSTAVDAFVFLLIVPPTAVYILYTAGHTLHRARKDSARLRESTLRTQQQKEDELAVSSHHVELQSMQSNPAAAVDVALQSPSGRASDEETQVEGEAL